MSPSRLALPEPAGAISREEIIVLTGDKFPSLKGCEIGSLQLAAMRGNELQAIPFQVDEVRDGIKVFDWVSPEGAKKGIYDRDLDHGKLDADDELVFMARDLGLQIDNIESLKTDQVIELAVTDPASHETAYAYLLLNSTLPASETDYVSMKISGGRLSVETALYKYSQVETLGYFDQLRLLTASGKWSPNLVVRNQTPVNLRVRSVGLSGELDFYDLIRGTTVAKKDGRVRALWRAAGGADFGAFKIKGEGGTEQRFYLNRIDQQVIMDIPFDFDKVLESFQIRGTVVLSPRSLPAMYYDVSHREGIQLDGAPDSPAGPVRGGQARDWCVLSSSGASIYYLVFFSEDWTPRLERTSYVDDRPDLVEAGSYFGEMVELLTKGAHVYEVRFYFAPREFEWGDEKRLPEISGQELTVSVKALR